MKEPAQCECALCSSFNKVSCVLWGSQACMDTPVGNDCSSCLIDEILKNNVNHLDSFSECHSFVEDEMFHHANPCQKDANRYQARGHKVISQCSHL